MCFTAFIIFFILHMWLALVMVKNKMLIDVVIICCCFICQGYCV